MSAAPTTIKVGDPKAVKRWSADLFVQTSKRSYWDRKFVGASDNHVIQRLNELESEAGDTITYDLALLLTGEPVYGDNIAEGKERSLKFATDEIKIDQMFYPVNAGGVMTRKRTLHNLRTVARNQMARYWARFNDEMMFIYMSGSRGINEGFATPITWAGHAGNPIQAPDTDHVIYGGTATAKANLTAAHKMSRSLIQRSATKAKMMREVNPDVSEIVPVDIDGGDHFVCLMTPFQEHDLKEESGTGGWLDLQKAAAAAEGRKNAIFKGTLGMIDDVVLHSHKSVIRFNDYGAGSDVVAARALFMGAQAGVIAYGSEGGGAGRMDWREKKGDYDRQLNLGSGTICGVKKARFGGKDFGIFAIDTAAADPNG